MTGKRTILIAGMGTSPAVLAETEWALCHQKKPPVPSMYYPVRGVTSILRNAQ